MKYIYICTCGPLLHSLPESESIEATLTRHTSTEIIEFLGRIVELACHAHG